MLARNEAQSVRVHEHAPEIREAGAGIYLRNNGLSISRGLWPVRCAGRARYPYRAGHLARSRRYRAPISRFSASGSAITSCRVRYGRCGPIARGGVRNGLNSHAVSAEPDGVLVLSDSKRCVPSRHRRGRLVRWCGIRSASARVRGTSTAVNRHFIPNRDITPDPFAIQHWSGNQRIGIAPSGDDYTYVYSICPARDTGRACCHFRSCQLGRYLPLLRRELEVIAAARAYTNIAMSGGNCHGGRRARRHHWRYGP